MIWYVVSTNFAYGDDEEGFGISRFQSSWPCAKTHVFPLLPALVIYTNAIAVVWHYLDPPARKKVTLIPKRLKERSWTMEGNSPNHGWFPVHDVGVVRDASIRTAIVDYKYCMVHVQSEVVLASLDAESGGRSSKAIVIVSEWNLEIKQTLEPSG